MLSWRRERGSGTLSAALGVTVFLAFLLLATHVLVNLWVASLVDHVAWDTTRRAASDPRYADVPAEVQAESLAWARARLGGHADHVELQFVGDPTGRSVILRVRARPATFVGAATHLGGVHTDVVVRREPS
mgnify:FL=1|jgi:hypothetical protein